MFARTESGKVRLVGEQIRNLLRLLSYSRRAWHLLVGLFVCILANSLLELAVPWVIGFMLLDGVVKRAELGRLPLVVMVLTGIFIAQKGFAFGQEYFQQLASQRTIHNLRCELYMHMERLPLRFFEQGRTGELVSRVTSDVDTLDGLLSILVHDMASQLVMFVGTLYFLHAVNARLTLFVVPTIPALVLSAFFFKRTVRRYARRARDLMGELAGMAGETIAGVRVVKAFCSERFEAARFSSKSSELLQTRVKTAQMQSGYLCAVDGWVFAGTVIVILTATPWVVASSFSVGSLVAYLSYLNKLYGPAKTLSKVNFYLQKIFAASDRIFDVLDSPLEGEEQLDPEKRLVVAKPSGDVLSPSDGGYQIPAAKTRCGEVVFERVSFTYDNERTVLKDFSLVVTAGEMVAIVGQSGAGKTTVVDLLLGFYKPTSGQIRIDSIPLDSIPQEMLRRQIGLVQQETFLFSGTLRDNIAYAQPHASDEQIIMAARAASAHGFIARFPDGYLTEIGERGVKLSGGERQRIAIARALLRKPRILILDEATSHLDSESEQLIWEALQTVAEETTVFCIAHRLSSVWRAEKIVVVEAGEIVEQGRHQELLALEGTYRKFHRLQLSPDGAIVHRGS